MPKESLEVIADPVRLESLRRLSLLDTPADPAFDRLTRLICRVFDAPMALVSLVDDRRQFLKSQFGLGDHWEANREIPLDYFYCQQVITAGTTLIIEDTLNHPLAGDNPSTLELAVRAYAGMPLITADGTVLGAFCVMDTKPRIWTSEEIETLTDFTQLVLREIELHVERINQRNLEDAQCATEQYLQAVINSLPVVLCVVNRGGVILLNEGKGLEVIDEAPNRIVGRSIFDVYADKPEIVAGVRCALTGEKMSILTEVETLLGLLPYETGISPLYDKQHNIVGAIGVAIDVSKRVSVERVVKRTVNRLTILRRVEVEMSESLNLDSVLRIAMDAALRATGAEHGFIGLLRGEEVVTVHTMGAFAVGMTYSAAQGVVGRVLRTHQAQFVLDSGADPDFIDDIPGARAEMAIPLIHRERLIGILDLKTAHPEVFTQDAFDFLTLLAGHITIAIDNAQLYQVSRQQLDELQHLYKRVTELEQLKTEMLRIAAHDLRSPLNVIEGYVDIMLEDHEHLSLDHMKFVQTIQRQTGKMFKMIEDILSLQRIEALQKEEDDSEIDLAELVREAFSSNEALAQQKTQLYRLLLPEFALPFHADAILMREALDNLIGNAIKYTPEGGSVTVKLETDGAEIVFEVEDTGLGVPEHQQSRLFEPFFRASNAKKSDIAGTGLGLHLVKNIIERIGGHIRFRSTLGEGSVFGFTLPVK